MAGILLSIATTGCNESRDVAVASSAAERAAADADVRTPLILAAPQLALGRGPPPAAPAREGRTGYVDSILPIPEQIRRFQAAAGIRPIGFSGGERSRAALVRRYASAIEARDTAALRAMLVSRAEFAYLVYPESKLARPPYELPPALLWFQLQQESEKGAARTLRRLGGHPLGAATAVCPAATRREGANRLWEQCSLQLVTSGDTVRTRLFGTLILHGGQVKFLSYASDF